RVVPDEERLVGAAWIVAVEEVDDLGGDFLVHRLGPLKGQRPLILAGLGLRRAVGGFGPEHRSRRGGGRRGAGGQGRQGPRASRGSACSCTPERRSAALASC